MGLQQRGGVVQSRELFRRLTLVLTGLVLGAASHAAFAQQPVTLTTGLDAIPLAGSISVLKDETGALTIDDVRSPQVAARFESAQSTSFNFGYTSFPYWYRIPIRGLLPQSGQPADWVFQVAPGILDYVDIYVVKAGRVMAAIPAGDKRHHAPELLSSRKFGFPLHLVPGQEAELFVRVVSGSVQVTDFELWTLSAFEKKTAREHVLFGGYFGVLLIIAVYNLIIYLWIRDRAYLYYILYIFSISWLSAVGTGYGYLLGDAVADSGSIIISNSMPQALFTLNMFTALFARDFMQLRTAAPIASRVHLLFVALALAGLMLSPFMSYALSQQMGFLGGAVGGPFSLVVSAWLAIKGSRAARFYLLAWTMLTATSLLFIVAGYVLRLPFGSFQYAWQFGVCLEAVLLSLALADRIAQERKGRYAATEAANRLKSFLPQKVADLVGGGNTTLLEPKRRNVTVCVIDLRGFTPFSEAAAPEHVMSVLREFYDSMGKIVEQHGGTVEHFAGDSMLIFFNAPLEIAAPEQQAVITSLEMRAAFEPLREKWTKLGHELGLGIGIAEGDATIGAIGFSGRLQYAAIGAVSNLASRLCGLAQHGEILTTPGVLAAVKSVVDAESIGEQSIKGFSKPVAVVSIRALRAA